MYNIYVWLAGVFSIDQDVIQIYYNKDIKFFNKDLVDVILKTGQYIRKTKGHDLVLKITVSDIKGRLPLIIFSNSHLIISTSEIQMGKSLGLI